ncbi:TPA: energy transducer TonB [Stenotrophomonas maltophilia]|nr:energy transducer TonB [Stenotrophomonas maltophilia]HDS1027315.1 energy transducer TonB [Stenotrophomonas maltophilia]HDS1031253.1 energy transducer TonB [Stenotrophomonas maltophilia]HDS1036429.1 energy transducer TonB [Stenotrophomonas maltophilia]
MRSAAVRLASGAVCHRSLRAFVRSMASVALSCAAFNVLPVACEPAPATASTEHAAVDPQDAPAALDLASRYGNAPIYPGQAYRDGLEGEVIVVCHVAADSTLADAVVETRSGWAVLDETALVAVRKWKYTAARKNGVPVPGQVRIPVSFEQP